MGKAVPGFANLGMIGLAITSVNQMAVYRASRVGKENIAQNQYVWMGAVSKMVSATALENVHVALAGKVVSAMSAFPTMDVDMVHVRIHGSVSVMKAGVAFSATKI